MYAIEYARAAYTNKGLYSPHTTKPCEDPCSLDVTVHRPLASIFFLLPLGAGKHIGHSVYKGLLISEVMSANATAVPDENGEYCDWMELYNGTGSDLDMEGVMITDRTDRITFPFPAYTLKAGARVMVFASDSYQLDPGKPFHGKFKISSAGAHLYLYDQT